MNIKSRKSVEVKTSSKGQQSNNLEVPIKDQESLHKELVKQVCTKKKTKKKQRSQLGSRKTNTEADIVLQRRSHTGDHRN